MKHGIRHNVTWLLTALHTATGSEYIELLKNIIQSKEFKPVPGEQNVFAMPSSTGRKEYYNLLEAARKATPLGYKVYIMPNPKEMTSMDFIFERKGIVKDYELKTLEGTGSAENRLAKAASQSRRILVNVKSQYNPRNLSRELQAYMQNYSEILEVLVLKGRKSIKVTRKMIADTEFRKIFLRWWQK